MKILKKVLGCFCIFECIFCVVLLPDLLPYEKWTMFAVFVCFAMYAYFLLKKSPSNISPIRIWLGVGFVGCCIASIGNIITPPTEQISITASLFTTILFGALAFWLLHGFKRRQPVNNNVAPKIDDIQFEQPVQPISDKPSQPEPTTPAPITQAFIQPVNTNVLTYQQTLAKYKQLEIDYRNNPKESVPLVGAEKSFLKYVNNHQIDSPLPVYWFYEYGFNTDNLLSKLFGNGYLRISTNTETIESLTIAELKPILRKFNLVQSGKKAELIQRIKENVPNIKLEPFVKNKQSFVATPKGTEIIKNTPDSITKDIDFEDNCLTCILNNNLENAYKLVCQRELNKKSPRGIGVNWHTELQQGLSQNQKQYYQGIIKSPKESNIQIKACVVLCEMLGSNKHNLKYLFSRITGKTYNSKESYAIYYSLTQELSANRVKEEFYSLGVERYQILGDPDCNHYEICKQNNGKIYPMSEYKTGQTAPPFHEKCTCTVIPYFEDSF